MQITGSGCDAVELVFLGPLAYVGSGGGGEQVPGLSAPAKGSFDIHYVIPAAYTSGGNVNEKIPVTAGRYGISSYPAGACAASFTVTAPGGTEQILYQPWRRTGIDPTLHVTGSATGNCNSYRGAAGPTTYFRCIATGGTIYDPCFVDPYASGSSLTSLACPGDPTTDAVTTFTATSPVGSEGLDLQVIEPWAMELASGQTCRFISAAWGNSGPYSCEGGAPSSDGSSSVADCRVPHPSSPDWTTSCQPQLSDSSPFSPTTVEKLWF